MAKWVVYNKKAPFKEIGAKFGIDQVTARIIRNRDITDMEEIRMYLEGTDKDFYDPHLLKDSDLLTDILIRKIKENKKIRIIGDYDIDGVMSTYILIRALTLCHAQVSWQIPDRIIDGYGLNENLIRTAFADGIDTILTCDNGIAAMNEIALAKSLGMTVLVTDHHEIPYEIADGEKREKKSQADAVVNAHQKECPYPNKNMCGAAVAWKVVWILFEKMGIDASHAMDLLENAAFATVGDVMSLTGENRIIVKEGLRRIRNTKNIGMKALILQCGLEESAINAYHFGFVLGPCINASGRLDTANRALELLLSGDLRKAAVIANELVVLNNERKDLTRQGVELAKQIYEEQGYDKDRVLVIYLPGVHESIAGIIAGKIRETYHKPTIIMTEGKEGLKGSGRSIEAYSMYDELCKCADYMSKFGGHPMAAGLSMPEEHLDAFRKKLNACCSLTDDDLIPKIHIDVPMPLSYVTMELVREFSLLEPYGKDNEKPVFADRNLAVERMWIIGRNQNVLRLSLRTADGMPASAIYFGNIQEMQDYIRQKFGADQLDAAFRGRANSVRLSAIYVPSINSFRGTDSLQFEIKNYC